MSWLILLSLAASWSEGAFAERCTELICSRGAIAVMDLRTGRLLAATDPLILFSKRFPPGSVAKILTALVALGNGVELPEDFVCKGFETSGKDTVFCSVRTGHGVVDFEKAFEVSCNLYFRNIAKSLEAQDLADLARRLRLDRSVGVDLPGEVESIIDTPLSDSAKLDFAIGQGSSIQLTPVAMLSLVAGIASGGELLRPRLCAGSPEVLSSFPSPKALARLRPLLRHTVKRGTGQPAEISTVAVAGKTGTSTILGNWVTHGWFVGFAPYDAPEIALVVFLNRGEGKDAARIAGLVFSDYFSGNYAER